MTINICPVCQKNLIETEMFGTDHVIKQVFCQCGFKQSKKEMFKTKSDENETESFDYNKQIWKGF